MQGKKLTNEQALQKLRHFCRYQERCCSEVTGKMFELRVAKSEQAALLEELLEDNFLNEERFASSFATGRFKLRSWGRKKIFYALKEKRIADQTIQKALDEIDSDEYERVLQKLFAEKYEALSEDLPINRKKKTIDYLLQKGFEYDSIRELATHAAVRD